MNLNPIKYILKFNQEAGLLDKPYDDYKEAAYTIEEALEGFDTTMLARRLLIDDQSSPKEVARAIVTGYCVAPDGGIPEVDRFDKALDGIVFNFGAIFKLRIPVQQAMKGLLVVAMANMKKLTVGTDSEGKQMKPEGFVGPETQLQTILDERK